MRLSKLKLAGFKSFVDPTTLQFPGNLTGIVGPNGCGKSNTIDAVRWVMGESSAKHLRGDSMADVIFSGSSARKPVSQASVELIFDNSDGAAGGEYAAFSEISIKRVVTRDGQSTYHLNGSRCRRKDITDLFLGTGLGPRSYSIIEQGMISRIIEAKPEELRVYLEEAAGISKYKERRRETENRIKHTRENLERLNDLREEINKQLAHLNRQARTAERYKEYKTEERQLKAELIALRWRALNVDAGSQERQIQERETAMEAALAEQRATEANIEKFREQHVEASEHFNEVQVGFYGLGADIARLEQAIQHGKERIQQQREDLNQVERSYNEAQAHIDIDSRRIEELEAGLAELEPEYAMASEIYAEAAEDLAQAEQAMHDWQAEWEEFNRRASEPAQISEVERARIEHLEGQLIQLSQRRDRLEEERNNLSGSAVQEEIRRLNEEAMGVESEAKRLQGELDAALEALQSLRDETTRLGQEIHQRRENMQGMRGRLTSLEALQEAALGKREGAAQAWLKNQGYQNASRLAEHLQVAAGWERAVEAALGGYLEAVCVEGIDAVTGVLGDLDKGSLTFFDTRPDTSAETTAGTVSSPQSLATKITAPWMLDGLLAGVYAADDLAQALSMRDGLAVHESVVTRDGLWLGAGWLRVTRDVDAKAGIIERESEIKQLGLKLKEESRLVEELEQCLKGSRDQRREREESRDRLQQEVNQSNRRLAELKGLLHAREGRLEQVTQRITRLGEEHAEIVEHITRDEQTVRESRARLNESLSQMEALDGQRETLQRRRDTLREGLDSSRGRGQETRDTAHRLALQIESMRSGRDSTQQGLERMKGQLQHLQSRRDELEQSLAGSGDPIRKQEMALEEKLAARMEVEQKLGEARRVVEGLDEQMRVQTRERSEAEQRVSGVRRDLEQMRMNWQTVSVRRKTLEEQLDETGHTLEALFQVLPEEAAEAEWEQKVEQLAQRIQRLGPINLAAIDEFKEQSERKVYLDSQNDDLTEALDTLESVIRKLDRETRTRFKETFDKVNSGIQRLFPRLFGGGHAYLDLTGEDLLETGVTVMARPPGKRVSNISLLSGGEKALTAVALVFAIFELNPAPFCMLDEVDAPLDEANVARFCNMVKEMSDRVQFIFITHNKTTMEMSYQLSGVTMHEPGVSRMVAVDVEEAAQFAGV